MYNFIATLHNVARFTVWGAALVSALTTVSGCGTEDDTLEPKVSAEQATDMADEMLIGLNDGEYEAFSRYWSDDLKAGIPESDFLAFRDMLIDASGYYVDIDDVDQTEAETDGYVKYVITCEFEKEPVTLSLVIPEDGEKVDGINISSENLSEAQ